MVGTPTLEIIATSVEDALAIERGGADRLEVVAAMADDGLLPDTELVRRLRDAVTLPLRVMLRSRPGFGTDARELAALCRAAERLRTLGVAGFVFGFLTQDGRLDLAAMLALHSASGGGRWTLHRAFDQVVDIREAWLTCQELPGLDAVLSAGSRAGIGDGLARLCERAAWQTGSLRWLAGGGLRLEHLPALQAAGITQFHSGRAVRRGGSWDGPVDAGLVRQWKAALGGASEIP
ncbi:MAG TPA: copper homeostasis protein CutC [Chloroflexota bacterium]|nr:copper homeostasis protein CutC [Chloroflexota bacterium]